ncbi:MerR family transcriptional regulator [Streptococcus chenjunshii]|uniref:MerR family transcriptional regulator n=1 Tax=Streptococcus chenjunshii TaxID=2173853 RepID=A0A372KNQ0_9STRE|nr:MerR family transcriptional regulator [Streptococcus chenjunshii]AXQ77937.1 MerR family transcriptional regulator [Streptococcus chenjunshii]RFU51819.1 MerR family transcriptional regulator [Streptococcus chenjunshii]RFU53907.1 MerR family transcriptional regulator [Streptococcus chenjunshii]
MTTIKQVSEELGLSPHSIRFYEKEGMVTIPRNAHGIRDFDVSSIDRLKAIAHYRRVGMSLRDIQAILAEFHNHALSTKLLEKTQIKLEKQIEELKETNAYLTEKIKIHRRLAELEARGYDENRRTAAYYEMRLQDTEEAENLDRQVRKQGKIRKKNS